VDVICLALTALDQVFSRLAGVVTGHATISIPDPTTILEEERQDRRNATGSAPDTAQKAAETSLLASLLRGGRWKLRLVGLCLRLKGRLHVTNRIGSVLLVVSRDISEGTTHSFWRSLQDFLERAPVILQVAQIVAKLACTVDLISKCLLLRLSCSGVCHHQLTNRQVGFRHIGRAAGGSAKARIVWR
jgi:hypothetical protein